MTTQSQEHTAKHSHASLSLSLSLLPAASFPSTLPSPHVAFRCQYKFRGFRNCNVVQFKMTTHTTVGENQGLVGNKQLEATRSGRSLTLVNAQGFRSCLGRLKDAKVNWRTCRLREQQGMVGGKELKVSPASKTGS